MPNKTAGVQVGKESHTDPEIKILRELSLAVALELTGWDPDAAGRLLAAQGVDFALAENPAAALVSLVRAAEPPSSGPCPGCLAASESPFPGAAGDAELAPEVYPGPLTEILAQARDNPGFAAKLEQSFQEYGLPEAPGEMLTAAVCKVPDCPQPPRDGGRMCADHYARTREHYAQVAEGAAAGKNRGKAAGRKKGGLYPEGICPGCRREPKLAGLKLCAKCQDANDRNKARQQAERDAAALAAQAAE